MSQRPQRLCTSDFSGQSFTLPDGPESWEQLRQGRDVLALGQGPDDAARLPFARQALAAGRTVYCLPDARLAEVRREAGQRADLPEGWRGVEPDAAARLAVTCAVFFYRPCLRLAPGFWGPFLGMLDAMWLTHASDVRLGAHAAVARSGQTAGGCQSPRTVLVPGHEGQLLHAELRQALTEHGFSFFAGERDAQGLALLKALREKDGQEPAFLLSVNLRGMDAEGRLFHACRVLGIAVALWFVDNPWHILSRLRLPWWREAMLFVSDASFVPALREAGATAQYLPLAVASHMWRPLPGDGQTPSPPLFVGRSRFPDHARFFAAARVDQARLAEAMRLLRRQRDPEDASPMPHVHWWAARCKGPLWPGHAVRSVGLGAELCARSNRARWIAAGVAAGMRVVGDEGWAELVPGLRPEAPMDYYADLPRAYHEALAVLNVTSLLMPESLSQRHFDVWAAGGFLLSDATPGLRLFPEELTRPVTLREPGELAGRLAWLRAHAREARALREAWREHLREHHSYARRVAAIRDALGV